MSDVPASNARSLPVYDAVVVGAGIVGLATALALARQGRQVAVVERRAPRRRRGGLGWDARSVALSPPALDFLRTLADVGSTTGAGSDVPLAPIDAMHVWEHDGAASLDFAGRPGKPLAWVVENSALTTCLWQAARQSLAVVAPATVAALAGRGAVAELTLADAAGALRTRLAVAADGAESPVRGLAGAGVRQGRLAPDHRQYAIATVARLREPHNGTAWQRFGATGPAALLPLPEAQHAAVIWCATAAKHDERVALDDEAFREALDAELEGAGGGIAAIDRRLGFPARQTLAADLNPLPRVVLAGDAVRTLHPLAGQGVNLGLEDAEDIAETAAGAGGDLGAPGLWRGYARRRRVRSKAMLALMSGLLAAYGRTGASEPPWRRLARNTALRAIDASPGAKAQLVREAMGLGPLAGRRAGKSPLDGSQGGWRGGSEDAADAA